MWTLSSWVRLSKKSEVNYGLMLAIYLALSTVTLLLFQLFSNVIYSPVEALLIALFTIFLIALAMIDAITGYLPNALTIPLMLSGLAFHILGKYVFPWHLFSDPTGSFIGAFIGYGLFYIANQIHRRIKGFDGIGMGDAKLLAAIGAWFGVENLVVVVATASALSLAIPLFKWILRKPRGSSLAPFGPFLAVGGLISLIKLPL